ncbi:hypothetical protein BRC92_12530 [Halobacteriales archaeon QS_4_69_31]|nr:MAG: hypothetical protein BRC92_12530 [Halobacteriales archaeon QS_4_69_31]
MSASTPPAVLTQIEDLRKPKTCGFRKGGESASLPSLKRCSRYCTQRQRESPRSSSAPFTLLVVLFSPDSLQ